MAEQNHRRERVLLVGLVLLLAGLGWREYGPYIGQALFPDPGPPPFDAILEGETRITGVRVAVIEPSLATIKVDYFYNGKAGELVDVVLDPASLSVPGATILNYARVLGSGSKSGTVTLHRPMAERRADLRNLHVWLRSKAGAKLGETIFAGPVAWPSGDPFELASNDAADIEKLYTLCVTTIDSGRNLEQARRGLEQIVLADPKFIKAYAEMARYHMKSNWSPTGLARAEQDLKTALSGDPQHADSLVLLGYVYAHQGRFKEADGAFQRAEATGTPNIWLPVNEGELRAMQKRPDDAIKAYQRAIDAPKSLPTYEHARNQAFTLLLEILESRKQWGEMDKQHARRVELFPDDLCAKTRYSEFKLRTLGDYAAAIPLASSALERGCRDARRALSEAYLLEWVATLGKDPAAADNSFRRGQALIDDPVTTIFELAHSPKTAVVLPQLAKHGFDLDGQDSGGLTPLGRAVLESDVQAARVLLRSGVNVNKPLNADGFDVLMLAASRGDKNVVLMLLKNGANAEAKTRSGMNAAALARSQGFHEIAAMLSNHGGT